MIDRDCKMSHAYVPINVSDKGGIQDLMLGDAHTTRRSYKRPSVEGGSATMGVRVHGSPGKFKK